DDRVLPPGHQWTRRSSGMMSQAGTLEKRMATKKTTSVPPDALAAARQRAAETRRLLESKPNPSELLTDQELADAAPFYFILRDYIRQLKEAREAAGVTLAEVSARSGLAVESLSRLETG